MHTYFHCLKLTIGIDIGWINYFWGHRPDYWLIHSGPRTVKNTLASEIIKHCAKIGRSLFQRLRWQGNVDGPFDFLFYVDSINQWRALRPIQQQTPNSAMWVEGKLQGELLFPADLARIFSFFFLPLVFWEPFRKVPRFEPWTIRYGLSQYLDAYGHFFIGMYQLSRRRPKALIVSNDHGPQPRALIAAAKYLRIPTFYVQHAPVTPDFPPLEVDYALLDGLSAQQKYSLKNPACKIFLVGMARRASTTPRAIEEISPHPRIGLAFNDNQSESDVESLLREFAAELPHAKVVLRPHPAGWRKFKTFRKLAEKFDAEYSDPETLSSWEYLQWLDVLVGGNSGIMLEAAFLGVIPLQHALFTKGYDHYGYQEFGITYSIKSISEIQSLLHRIVEVRTQLRDALQKFDATYRTPHDGKSAEISAQLIFTKSISIDSPMPDHNHQRSMPSLRLQNT